MTTRFDEDDDPDFGPPGPEHDPDDPLLVLLSPTSTPSYLGAPPGRFEEIRRTATRRRRTRTAAGVGMVCAVAALIALPLNLLTTSDTSRSPTVPQAPPAPTSPATPPADSTPAPTPAPATPRPSPPATTGSGDPTYLNEVPTEEPPTDTPDAPSQAPADGTVTPPDESPVPTPAASTAPTPEAIVPTARTAGDAVVSDSTAAP
ncbi:hypothetical protein PV396_27475 [Streptomyces sp. ME02-8801-2C]|nr:hypothetical protein [Streptomyces sp. ME02-8801-2C]